MSYVTDDDVREFLTVCLMCGDGVRYVVDSKHPDLVDQWLEGDSHRDDILRYCDDQDMLTGKMTNQAGEAVFYVTPKGLELLK